MIHHKSKLITLNQGNIIQKFIYRNINYCYKDKEITWSLYGKSIESFVKKPFKIPNYGLSLPLISKETLLIFSRNISGSTKKILQGRSRYCRFQMYIQNPIKHLRWSVLRKQFTKRRQLFLQNVPSQMFNRFLNMLLDFFCLHFSSENGLNSRVIALRINEV